MNITVRSPSLLMTSVVAAVYSLIVCGLLVVDATRRLTKIPLDSPEFLVLKDEFLKEPGNQDIQDKVRALDFELRQEYFREQRFTKSGVLLLLAGVIIMLVTGKWSATIDRKLPRPAVKEIGPDSDERLRRHGPWAVAVVVVALLGTIWAMNATHPSQLPDDLAALAALKAEPTSEASSEPTSESSSELVAGSVAAKPAAPELPTAEAFLQSWPHFRGPQSSGISKHSDIPAAWDVASGEGIVWKIAVPLPGVSSPIVWQDRVFLTGATEERREVYCFDAADGKILWQKELSEKPGSNDPPIEVSHDTGYAAPTMATDGRFVYAMFATGDVAAFDFAGQELWHITLGPLHDNTYGHAASLTTYKELVIVQVDHGKADDEASKVLALDGATGRVVWQAARKVPSSWSSPVVVEHEGQAQVIACGDPWVIAYAAATGTELWRANCLPRSEIGPTPIYSDGMVFAVNEYAKLSAIRIDGSGDVTDTHIAWQAEDGLPDACSPLATDKLLLLLASFGTLTCYDKAEGGDPLWEEDFEEDFTSSPSLVGDNVYLFGKSGKVWIVHPTADECERIAEADLGEECVTSPAFQDGRIYVRGSEHLFCIGSK
jgi:outer membrane protein assembly factor BamB